MVLFILLTLGISLKKVNTVINPKTIRNTDAPVPKTTSIIGKNSLSLLSKFNNNTLEEPNPLKKANKTACKKIYFSVFLKE